MVNTLTLEPAISSLSLLSVKLLTQSVTVPALVDSGSSNKFLPKDLLSRLHLPHSHQARELRVKTIDLLPGLKLPKGRICTLSNLGCKAMEEYIQEALNEGLICPSSFPAASSLFFVGKKDRGLWPCIEYRALNSQMVKLLYTLPLVPAALEELRGACIFSKLDLRSAYNLVRIWGGDEWKTVFITPTGHYKYLVMQISLSNCLPRFYERGVPPSVREFLHRLYTHILPELGRPSPSREAGSPEASSTPSVPQAGEV